MAPVETADGAPVTGSRSAWPLTGRDGELQLMVSGLTSAPGVVVLAGAPGVGKSRLAAEAMALLRSRDWATREAFATESAASITFGALAHLLPPSHPPGATALEILIETSRALGAEGRRHRLALWVDDAHLLDKASAALVHRLAVDRSVSLLVTTRAGSPAPDPITALWKEGIASRLDLEGLSEAEVGRLLGAALGGHIDGKSLHLLTEAAAGNVLYLHELVLSGIATGALSQASGIWRCSGPIAPGAALTELIEERLSGLVPAQRRLLEALALAEPLDAGLFQRLAPAPVVESVEDSGLVAAVDSAGTLRVRVAHPLYAEVLRKGIPRLRAKALLRELADGMEAVEGRRPEGILRSSVLRLESGDRIETDRALAAAQWALQLGDYQLAENLIRSAETDAGFAGRLVLGDALIRQHREDEAEQLLAAVVPAGDAEVARLAVVRASNLVHGLGRHEEAISLLVASENRVDARSREELLATRALFLAVGASNGGGLELANEVIARPGVTPTPLARSCAAAAYALAFAGRPDEALRLLEAHGLPGGGPRIGYVENVVMSARGTALMLSGCFEEARQFTMDRYRQALQEGQEAIRAYWAFMWGLDVPYTGNARAAMDRLREAIAISRTADPQYVLASALATLAQAAAMCGDVRTAGEAISEVEALPHVHSLPVAQANIERSRGWMSAAGGEMAAACRHAMASAETYAEGGRPGLEALSLLDLARFGDPLSAWTRLQPRALELEGVLLPAAVRYVGALRSQDARELGEVSAAFQSMGAHILATEAARHAALAWRRSGRMGTARTWQLRAAELLRSCEGARPPTLPNLDLTDVLTAREAEVAGLAARGLTSPEIAGRLSISVRTVDNHLQQVFSKLEIRSRRELRAALGSSRSD